MVASESAWQDLVARVREGLAPGIPDVPPAREAPRPPPVDDGFDLAPLIDHSLLTPTATDADVRQLCEEAMRHGFHSVCVHGARLQAAVESCGGAEGAVAVACVVDFPLGAGSTDSRLYQAAAAVDDGARELDLVAPAGVLEAALPGDEPAGWDFQSLEEWSADVIAVSESARAMGECTLKLILETDRLNPTQIVAGALLAEHAGVDFVKTSTGFGQGGATRDAVALLHASVGGPLGVKASGGIRTRAEALALVRAGATRLGTSRSVVLLGGPAGA